MVFVTGYGQMCNNILQFGHFYAYSKKHNVKIIAMRFCYKYRYFTINSKPRYNWFTYIFAKYMAKLSLIKSVDFDENYTSRDAETLLSGKMVLAKGWYFRDYDGFLNYRKEIKNLFDFKPHIKSSVNRFWKNIDHCALKIGIHIRRGDYKNWHHGAYYFTDEEYCFIINSLLRKLNTNVKLIISSNEPKLNVKKISEITSCETFALNGNPAEDLYLLSKCDYIIGPPSTFSLTAAFYEDKPLYWIFDKHKEIGPDQFDEFENLFRHII